MTDILKILDEARAMKLVHAVPKFKIGQRVRPNSYGIERNIFTMTRQDQTGVVTNVDRFNTPTVLWQGRKRPKGYYGGFIAIDRRRKTRS